MVAKIILNNEYAIRLFLFLNAIGETFHNLRGFLMTTAAVITDFGFDLSGLKPSAEAETGKWFMALEGKMEICTASSGSKTYRKAAMRRVKAASKAAGGKDFGDLPLETTTAVMNELLAKQALKGWATLIPRTAAEAHNLAHRETYRANDDKTPEGFVLVDYAILDGNLLACNEDNALKVFKEVERLRDEVASLSGSTEQFLSGGLDALD
jgi:hypothetical protein